LEKVAPNLLLFLENPLLEKWSKNPRPLLEKVEQNKRLLQ
jgi:hypothetical protein